MKYAGKKIVIIITAVLFIVAALTSLLWAASLKDQEKEKPQSKEAAVQAESKDAPDSRENRIDFGNTYIIGQTIKSGAVYLLQRKKSEIKSMLKHREDYRDEILEGFLNDAYTDIPGEQEGSRAAKRDSQSGGKGIAGE